MWSPDSQGIGWTSGSCNGSSCFVDAFNHQAVRGSAAVTTVQLPEWSDVSWSTTNRLLVVAYAAQYASVQRVYSMALDGTDEQQIAWGDPAATPMWSPDGKWLAAGDGSAGPLRIRDALTGADRFVTIPTGLSLLMWSPDSEHLVLFGGDGPPYTLFTVDADGTGFRSLGNAQDVTWRPAD
jgi:Tol biopolymer transport system component